MKARKRRGCKKPSGGRKKNDAIFFNKYEEESITFGWEEAQQRLEKQRQRKGVVEKEEKGNFASKKKKGKLRGP